VDTIGTDYLVLNRILPLHVWTDSADVAGSVAEKGKSRKAERLQLEAAKAERLQHSCAMFFKRPGEAEKWAEFDESGFPLKAKGEEQPLSKNATKQLRKEFEKHKKEREAAGFQD